MAAAVVRLFCNAAQMAPYLELHPAAEGQL
jgi:hypothetical protein